ncbi:hypothetical protein IWX91DRAFT_350549 [Phyllosticta citricarpa]
MERREPSAVSRRHPLSFLSLSLLRPTHASIHSSPPFPTFPFPHIIPPSRNPCVMQQSMAAETIHPSPNSQIFLASKALSFTSMHAGQSINQRQRQTPSRQPSNRRRASSNSP